MMVVGDSEQVLPVIQAATRPADLGGDDMRKAFEAATGCLERCRDAINALNVFPVPDGDTGTNMLLTMRSVTEGSQSTAGLTAGEVTKAMAHGALLGARGNSGVILSQFFQGVAQGLDGRDRFNGTDLAGAFHLAAEAAYHSVSKPVDGTIITVMRELSEAASRYVEAQGASPNTLSVWGTALEAAKEALSTTPLQLPVLREAGVVDAGGQGLVVLLEGAWRYLRGENIDDLEIELCSPNLGDPSSPDVHSGLQLYRARVREEYLPSTEDVIYGYCTQFLIQGEGMDPGDIRAHLSSLAESTVVVGNENTVKVHVHILDPGPVISYAVSLGTISQVGMDNMDEQHGEFLDLHRGKPRSAGETTRKPGLQAGVGEGSTAVVAVAPGEGFSQLFEGLGCSCVVTGGQSKNPSTQELLRAAAGTGASLVILLPNNPNVIPAAMQAASLAEERPDLASAGIEGLVGGMRLHVIPSRTIPQGVASLLAFNPEGDPGLDNMVRAIETVKTVEVTTAVRQSTVGGLAVKKGQFIGILDGEIVAATDSALSALRQALLMAKEAGSTQGETPRHELLTLYWGEDADEKQARDVAEQLRNTIPVAEVEVVYGGQQDYPYIASLE